MSDIDFRLKGSVVTTVVLEIRRPNVEQIVLGLKEKIAQVPQFFHQAPLIVDLSTCDNVSFDLFEQLIENCRGLGLAVMGWRASEACIPEWRAASVLPMLPTAANRKININSEESAPASDPHVVIKTVVEEREIAQPATLITKPIRSGQQIYAAGDLIVVSQVSAGAEVLAEGNIHIYGALRGRALAGIKGNTEARIFCRSMEAELVSIAGNFMLSDALQNIIWKDTAQVLLVDDILEVVPL